MLYGRRRHVFYFVRYALNDDDNIGATYSQCWRSTFRLETRNVFMTWKMNVVISGTIVCITWDKVNVKRDVITSLRSSTYTINKTDVSCFDLCKFRIVCFPLENVTLNIWIPHFSLFLSLLFFFHLNLLAFNSISMQSIKQWHVKFSEFKSEI